MKPEIKGQCPICGGENHVTRFQCTKCHTAVEGEFVLNKFSKLSEEQLRIVELFLLHRGNMKEMEKSLNISYPTVRNKLEEIVETLGHTTKKHELANSREEILQKLSAKEITADEAVELLKLV